MASSTSSSKIPYHASTPTSQKKAAKYNPTNAAARLRQAVAQRQHQKSPLPSPLSQPPKVASAMPSSVPSAPSSPLSSQSVDKPLPSPPVAQVLNPMSPVKAKRTLVDAEVAGTPTREDWPILQPEEASKHDAEGITQVKRLSTHAPPRLDSTLNITEGAHALLIGEGVNGVDALPEEDPGKAKNERSLSATTTSRIPRQGHKDRPSAATGLGPSSNSTVDASTTQQKRSSIAPPVPPKDPSRYKSGNSSPSIASPPASTSKKTTAGSKLQPRSPGYSQLPKLKSSRAKAPVLSTPSPESGRHMDVLKKAQILKKQPSAVPSSSTSHEEKGTAGSRSTVKQKKSLRSFFQRKDNKPRKTASDSVEQKRASNTRANTFTFRFRNSANMSKTSVANQSESKELKHTLDVAESSARDARDSAKVPTSKDAPNELAIPDTNTSTNLATGKQGAIETEIPGIGGPADMCETHITNVQDEPEIEDSHKAASESVLALDLPSSSSKVQAPLEQDTQTSVNKLLNRLNRLDETPEDTVKRLETLQVAQAAVECIKMSTEAKTCAEKAAQAAREAEFCVERAAQVAREAEFHANAAQIALNHVNKLVAQYIDTDVNRADE